MRILIDTNIFIYRENYHIIPSNLQSLLKTLNDLVVQILVHPLSVHEIEKDRNHERREITLSKIKTYSILDNPPSLEVDQQFLTIVGQTNNAHELVDNNLLYCVYKNAVDFLITEDRGIHRKSDRLGISDRVFDIDEALEYFKKQLSVEKVPKPPALKYVPVYNLDISDSIFTSLKEEYDEFLDLREKISREGRKAWVYFKGSRLGAILIYKIEDEAIASNPPLPKKRRLKLSTFKVTYTGYKIIEGNTIKKAYLSHSRIRKMSEGDILLFYRSVDERRITSLGVIEKVYHNIKNPDEIIRYVGKRSVYTKKEIEEIAKNPTKVILFKQHFHLRNPLALDYLRTNNIHTGAPQSIVRISHEKYLLIKRGGGINERFTIN
jgi:predicted nucleic acid-binding protein